jgi:hypothetical protein
MDETGQIGEKSFGKKITFRKYCRERKSMLKSPDNAERSCCLRDSILKLHGETSFNSRECFVSEHL